MLLSLIGYLLLPVLFLVVLCLLFVRRTSRALSAIDQRDRALFRENAAAMFIYDPASLEVLEANKAFNRRYQDIRQVEGGVSILSLVVPEQRDRLRSYLATTPVGARERDAGQWMFLTAHGEPRCVDAFSGFMPFGGRDARVVTLRDVSELIASERSHREVFNAVSIMLLVIDPDSGEILDANARTRDIFDMAPEEIVGKISLDDLSPGESDDGTETARQWVACALQARPHRLEWEARRRGGEVVATEVVLEVVSIGGRTRVLAGVTDISRRKAAERDRREYERRLSRLRDLDRAIAVAGSGREMATAAVVSLSAMLACDKVSVAILDPVTETAEVISRCRSGGAHAHAVDTTVMWADVFGVPEPCRAGEDVLIDDLIAIASPNVVEQSLIHAGVRTFAALPLMADERLIGLLTFIDHRPACLTRAQIDGMAEVVMSLSIGLQSARLREEVNAQAERLRQMLVIERAVLASDSLQETAQRVVDSVREWLGVMRVSFNRFDLATARVDVVAMAAESPDVAVSDECSLHEDGDKAIARLRQGHYALINDLEHVLRGERLERLFRAGARSWASFPLMLDGELYGSLNLASDRLHHFDEPLVEQVLDVVNGLAIALHQSVLADRVQRQNDELEARVKARTQELSHAMTHLVQSEKLAALGSLVAGVAHELNTPLGSAVTVASTLGDRAEAFHRSYDSGGVTRSELEGFIDQSREAASLLNRSLARAASLVSGFKQVAVDQTSSRRRPFDLAEICEDIRVALKPVLRDGQHEIRMHIPPGVRMESYPGPLEQVITNLVANSVLHGFDGRRQGQIELSATPQADRVHLVYRDDGVGIPPEMVDRVFDPFFTTRLGEGGSGLGMYIVFNLITGLLGGTLSLKNREGGGFELAMDLPCVAPDQVRQDLLAANAI